MEHNLVQDNPRLKQPVRAVLAQFEDNAVRRRDEVERAVEPGWDATCAASPAIAVDILVRNRALSEQAFVDGEPYDGKLSDVLTDERVADDAEAWSTLELTEEGRRLAAACAPENALRALFDERPRYTDAYLAVLWACSDKDGCTRSDLEAQLGDLSALQPDPQTGRRTVYPQHFIDALESAGAIVWDGAWRTTEAGRAALTER